MSAQAPVSPRQFEADLPPIRQKAATALKDLESQTIQLLDRIKSGKENHPLWVGEGDKSFVKSCTDINDEFTFFQRAFFNQHGFIVIKNYVAPAGCDEMMDSMRIMFL